MPRDVHKPFRISGTVVLLYLGLSCLLTFPGPSDMGGRLIGAGDNFGFVWELWWFGHALFDRHANPLLNDTLFFPTKGVPLVWSTPVNMLPGMVMGKLFGPVFAYNALVLSGLTLAGLGGYLLAQHGVRHRGAAFLAGAIFAFAPAHMAHVANGHLNIMTIQWMPFCALAWIRLFEAPSRRRAAWCALASSLVLLTDLYIALYFLAAFFGVFLCFNLDRLRDVWKPALAAGAGAALVAAPFYLPTLLTLHAATVTVGLRESVHRFGQDLVQLFLPAPWNPLLGFLSQPWTPRLTNTDNWGYLGWVPLMLAAIALFRRTNRELAFWAAFTGLAVLLAMGTYLHAGGPTGWPLPYLLWSKLPLLENLRAPGRFMEVAALGLAVLAAAGAARVMRRLGSRGHWLLPGLLLAVGLEYLTFFPFPTTSAAVPEYYRSLAHEQGVGGILELPNGDPTWGGPTQRWMYYQSVHRRPLVYGHSPRVTDDALAFSRETPLVRELTDLIHTDFRLELAPGDREGARERLAGAGITHVILHAVSIMPPERHRALEAQLTTLLGPPYFRDADMIVYRTRPTR